MPRPARIYTCPETPRAIEVSSNGVVEISLLPVCTGNFSILTRSSYREAVSTLDCALENEADLHVNERQKIAIALGLLKKEEECQIMIFFTSRGAYVNCAIIAMLYTYSIGNQP